MPISSRSPLAARSPERGWGLRDWVAGVALFAATAGVVLWQNAHVAVLFDLSYILNTATRIAQGQMPYRDFPLAHAPLTFLTQAAIIRLTGRVFFHHVFYVAIVGGMGTVLTWRIALEMLCGRARAAWAVSLLVAAPIIFVGIYCIVPNPEYDCDCGFWILVAVWLLLQVDFVSDPKAACNQNERRHPEQSKIGCHPDQPKIGCHPERDLAHEMRPSESKACPERRSRQRSESNGDLRLLFARRGRPRPLIRGFVAGAALVIPLFFKQNMGLPFLVAALGAVLLVIALKWLGRGAAPALRALLSVLAGACAALLAALLALHFTAGIGNYVQWTIRYAAERRLPGSSDMLGVYREPSLLWTLPSIAAGLVLFGSGLGKRRWVQIAAFALLAAPFLFTLASLLIYDDADSRGDSLLALWPLLLLFAAALAIANLFGLRREPRLRALMPLALLAAIHGAFMSQQLWGSTYAIWPLLALLVAQMLAFLDRFAARVGTRWMVPALAALISVTLLVCGGLYTASEERLSYANLPGGPPAHSGFPQLAGLATPGPYIPEIDELLRYAGANIPYDDGLVLIPGEEPFFFATGRVARFPVPFFDPTIDPYSPAEIASLVESRNIRWLIVKRDLQTKEDPTPDRAATMDLLMREFTLAANLHGYDIYRR